MSLSVYVRHIIILIYTSTHIILLCRFYNMSSTKISTTEWRSCCTNKTIYDNIPNYSSDHGIDDILWNSYGQLHKFSIGLRTKGNISFSCVTSSQRQIMMKKLKSFRRVAMERQPPRWVRTKIVGKVYFTILQLLCEDIITISDGFGILHDLSYYCGHFVWLAFRIPVTKINRFV